MHCLCRVPAPGKGSMVLAQHGRDIHRVLALKGLDDHFARIHLIPFLNLLGGQVPCTWYLPIKVIRMGGAITGKRPSGLGPCSRMRGMGVHDAADLLKCLVQLHMGRRVGGRVHIPFHLIAVQIHYHHIRCLQLIIIHAAGLNDKKALFPVNAADIAPGIGNQPSSGQLHIGLIYNLFQFL